MSKLKVHPPEDVFETSLRVRYAECDSFGILHHAKYLEYLEIARTELLRSQGTRYRDLEERGIFFVVANIEIRYKGPIRYDDVVTMKCWITRTNRARIDHAYQLLIDGVVMTEAVSTLACVGRDGRPIPMPEDLWEQQ